jgi:unsaturated rhamnogalacturonyl hydrolase
MKIINKIFWFFSLFVLILQSCSINVDDRSAREVAQSVVEKIIRETVFKFNEVMQKPVLNLQILDYKNQYDYNDKGVYYSTSQLSVMNDTTLVFGFDYTGAIKIFVNGKHVYEGVSNNQVKLKEIAYNMFVWNEFISIELLKGGNSILVKMVPVNKKPVFFMREVAENAEVPLTASFSSDGIENNDAEADWESVGVFAPGISITESLAKIYPPENEIIDEYLFQKNTYKWTLPKANILKELIIPETNSYKRESYIEWHYANGTTLMGMLAVADALNDETYSEFVSKVCSTNVDNKEMLQKQFDEYYAIRGTNNRMYRKIMLDDTGAPVLPYLQAYLNTKNEMLKPLIYEMADYVMNHQVRLEDRTFCRPEPIAMTIWADDLFMSVPFLVRMGKLTNDTKYYNDAAQQIINFNNYLFDDNVGLYKHAWFGPTNKKSEVYWGRANGWIVWATSEALMYLPKEHSAYAKIQSIYRKHIEGLVKYQDESGMWHQVLDKPESFKETSCTAMYILGIVRGVKNGWLDNKYIENALNAWNELKTKIDSDGTVKDICRGTGIGYDDEFYFNRKRFDNDPRGLGAVLTAATEIMKIEDMN